MKDGEFTRDIYLYSPESGTYQKFPEGKDNVGDWLADSRHMIYDDDGKIMCLDVESMEETEIYEIEDEELFDFDGTYLSSDNRWLYFIKSSTEADIWMMRYD